MAKNLLKSKSVWTAIAGLVTAAGAYATGEITGTVFVGSIFAALQMIFLRDAVNK